MATYAVGDPQGCARALRALLDEVGFEPRHDRLWIAGDLVNRGPGSLETLRFVRSLGPAALTVLGNHDLHLLARARGLVAAKRKDTLDAVLAAPDRDELLDWLIRRPLVHRADGFLLVHAGLLPAWSLDRAGELAAAAEAALGASDPAPVLAAAVGGGDRWDERLRGAERHGRVIDVLTRLRICTADGRYDRGFKGRPEQAPDGWRAWFDHRERDEDTVVFGHWSALGLHLGPRAIGLDTGCVWGAALTALRLEDRAVFQVACAD